jgi:hypothetical protein
MTNITVIGGHRYWTDLLEPKQTIEYYEALVLDLRAKKQGYGAWMAGRRVGEYASFARQQKLQIHGCVLSTDEAPVCSCGLIAEMEVPDASTKDHSLFGHPGHIDSANRQIVTAFYTRHRSDESQTWPWPLHFFCQLCSALQPAALTDDEMLDALLLEDFRTEHKHSEDTREVAIERTLP